MDIFGRFARDEHCIGAFNAADGGTWHSPFRPGLIYPATPTGSGSFEERSGLIVKTNVKTSNGYFEPVNPAIPARIDTPLDLRGRVSDYTVAVDVELAQITAPGQRQELAGQGNAYYASISIASICWCYYNAPYGALQMSQEIGGVRVAFPVRQLFTIAGRHIVAMVVSVNQSANTTTLSCYLDGVLIGNRTFTGIPTGIASPLATCYSFGDNRGATGVPIFGKFHTVLLFDRALSTGEIQLLR